MIPSCVRNDHVNLKVRHRPQDTEDWSEQHRGWGDTTGPLRGGRRGSSEPSDRHGKLRWMAEKEWWSTALILLCCCSVATLCLTLCDPMDCHTVLCPPPSPGACANSCPSSQWCYWTISSSAAPFSSCLQSFPASGSFPSSQFFASGDRSIIISVSASVLPVNVQGWFPLGWTGWISLIPLSWVKPFFWGAGSHCGEELSLPLRWWVLVFIHLCSPLPQGLGRRISSPASH